MAKAKSSVKDKTKDGNRTFFRVAEAGVVGPNGKAIISVGFKGRSIAKPDHAVEFFVLQTMDAVLSFLGWSSREAAEKDFDAAIKLLQAYKKDVE